MLNDILTVMINSLPSQLPIFVAADLSKIPLVPVDKIDATALFRELQKVRAEVDVASAASQRTKLAEHIMSINVTSTSFTKVSSSAQTQRNDYVLYLEVMQQRLLLSL